MTSEKEQKTAQRIVEMTTGLLRLHLLAGAVSRGWKAQLSADGFSVEFIDKEGNYVGGWRDRNQVARATGVHIPADKIAAARLRVKVGEQLNDPAPDWVRRLAEHDPKEPEVTPEEGGLYIVSSRDPSAAWASEVAQFQSGEFQFFGTDDNEYPKDVWIEAKVTVVKQ